MGRAFEQMPPLEACLDSIFVHYSEILLSISSRRASLAEKVLLEEEEPPVENAIFKVKIEKSPGRIRSFMS